MDRATKLFIHVIVVLLIFVLVSGPHVLQVAVELLSYLYIVFIQAIKFLDKYFVGVIGFGILYYFAYSFMYNLEIRKRYKRETGDNNNKYIAQRCYEDGYGMNKDGQLIRGEVVDIPLTKDTHEIFKKEKSIDWRLITKEEISKDVNNEDNRDYYYLVDRRKHEYRRIVDRYTFLQLGYPRPSREKEKCFHLYDEHGNLQFTLKEEVKILNPIADISAILKLKD